jgi:hypothetical protein
MSASNQPAPGIRLKNAPALAVLLVLFGIAAAPALAQRGASPAELRRENDALRERIAELEAALDEANRSIERLERELDEMLSRVGAGRPATAPAEPGVNPPSIPSLPDIPNIPNIDNTPDDPGACPDALYESLVESYNATFPGITRPPYTDVQQWVARVGTSRRRAAWVIKPIGDVTIHEGAPSLVSVNTVDPQSGEPICSAFVLELDQQQATRIRNATEVELWEISGTFAAEPKSDRTRPEFNENQSPKLIGPYAVFGWSFDVQSMKPSGTKPKPTQNR